MKNKKKTINRGKSEEKVKKRNIRENRDEKNKVKN